LVRNLEKKSIAFEQFGQLTNAIAQFSLRSRPQFLTSWSLGPDAKNWSTMLEIGPTSLMKRELTNRIDKMTELFNLD